MKVMSIIGIVWFSLSMLCVLGFSDSDPDASLGWGILGLIYAIAFAIVALVQSLKRPRHHQQPQQTVYDHLLQLNDLKEKNIITEEEFNHRKQSLLAMNH